MGFSSKSRSGSGGKGGGFCLILFGLVFASVGGAGTFFLAKEALKEAATYSWDETLCEINSIEIEADQSKGNSPFRLNVEFSYVVDGKTYTSTQYTRQEHWKADYEPLALQRKELLALADGTTCFVNPEDPAEAVVKREALAAALFALFPLIFVAIGVGVMIGGIMSFRKEKGKRVSISRGASSSNGKGGGRGVFLIVGVIFTLVGAGLAIPLGVLPLKRMMASNSWLETPCKVNWSRVLSHKNDDGTTYSVDIFYEYEFEGVLHKSNRYGFMTGSSSGRSGKRDIVKRYPKGSTQKCFVNPELPEQATLVQGVSIWVLLGLIPLIFLFIGLLLLFAALKGGSRKTVEPSAFRPSLEKSGPTVLSPGGRRFAKVGGGLLFSLFWNGITAIPVYQVIQGFKNDRPEWFLSIFMIPFVLVGLGMIIFTLYQLLALANPRPVVTLQDPVIRMGDELRLSWQMRGNSRRVSQFKIELVGTESATYRRGTRSSTDSSEFYRGTMVDSADGLSIDSGRVVFPIPNDLVPSLKLTNNQIKWQIEVSGDIPFWPDVKDTYEIEILPVVLS